jgi:hypothetical protein
VRLTRTSMATSTRAVAADWDEKADLRDLAEVSDRLEPHE